MFSLSALVLSLSERALHALAPVELVLCHHNDFHARYAPTDARGNSRCSSSCIAGIARIAQLLQQEGDECVKIHAGDWAQGSYYETVHGAKIAVDMVRRVNYTLLTLGNHEFDWGLWWPVQFMSGLNEWQHILVSNLEWQGHPSNITLLQHWEHPLGVCFVGVITPRTPHIVRPEYPMLGFKDPAASIRSAIDGCSIAAQQRVVVVSHLGYASDLELCDAVPAIDAIVGGHTHTLLEAVARHRADGSSCIVAQAGAYGLHVSRLALKWDEGGIVSSDASSTRMMSTEELPANPEVSTLLEESYSPMVQKAFEEVAGQLTGPLDNQGAVSQLLCDAMLWETATRDPQPALCFNNRGGVRNYLLDTAVSAGAVFEALPFDNTVATVQVPESVVHDIIVTGTIGSAGYVFGRYDIRRCSDGTFRIGSVSVRQDGNNMIALVSTDYVLTRKSNVKEQGLALELYGRKWNTVVIEYLKQLDTPYSGSKPGDSAAGSCLGESQVSSTMPYKESKPEDSDGCCWKESQVSGGLRSVQLGSGTIVVLAALSM